MGDGTVNNDKLWEQNTKAKMGESLLCCLSAGLLVCLWESRKTKDEAISLLVLSNSYRHHVCTTLVHVQCPSCPDRFIHVPCPCPCPCPWEYEHQPWTWTKWHGGKDIAHSRCRSKTKSREDDWESSRDRESTCREHRQSETIHLVAPWPSSLSVSPWDFHVPSLPSFTLWCSQKTHNKANTGPSIHSIPNKQQQIWALVLTLSSLLCILLSISLLSFLSFRHFSNFIRCEKEENRKKS